MALCEPPAKWLQDMTGRRGRNGEASRFWVHRGTHLILFSLSYKGQPSFTVGLRALAEILNLCISFLHEQQQGKQHSLHHAYMGTRALGLLAHLTRATILRVPLPSSFHRWENGGTKRQYDTNHCRCMKRFSTSLIITEIQIKTTMRHHFTPLRIAIIKKTKNNKRWWGCEKKGNPVHGW